MKQKFTKAFKIQAVQKALSRDEGVSVKEVADSLGVGFSTLQKLIRQSRNQELETALPDEMHAMIKEKRPQDWSLDGRLNMVIACASLSDEAISELCREKGIYPHNVNQWKNDFVSGKAVSADVKKQVDNKNLKNENKALKKELTRKDKALAETAALLVLQKKVNEIWGSDEDSSQ